MRILIATFLLLGLVVVSLAGFRGSLSRRPPLELIPDMDRQPKLRPQTRNPVFPDGLSSRTNLLGTVPRATPIEVEGQPVYPWQDAPVNTGRLPGSTNFVELNPLPVTAARLHRGQERYTIHCAPCHGPAGDGKGVTTKFGMTVIADLHDYKVRKVVQMSDGQLFDTLSHGKNLMNGYAANLSVEDRWAVVAYVRALQRSRLATLEDVPEPERAPLTK